MWLPKFPVRQSIIRARLQCRFPPVLRFIAMDFFDWRDRGFKLREILFLLAVKILMNATGALHAFFEDLLACQLPRYCSQASAKSYVPCAG